MKVRRDARVLQHLRVDSRGRGRPHYAVPARPLRDDELFPWFDGLKEVLRPRYLIWRYPETYRPSWMDE